MVDRVGNLIAFLPELEFDPFDDNTAAEWRQSMAQFWEKVEAIEGEAVHFIDASFKRLRSAEVSWGAKEKREKKTRKKMT